MGRPPVERSRSRAAARRRRRSRLRTTAGPTLRPMAKATRTSPVPGRCTTVIGPRRARRPSRRSASKVARSLTLPIRPRGARGPSAAATGRSRARRGSSSGDGTRAVSSGDACWADMCASPCASSATRPPRIMSGASGGNRNDPATNSTRGGGAPAPVPGTTVEVAGTRTPTSGQGPGAPHHRTSRGKVPREALVHRVVGASVHIRPGRRSPALWTTLVGRGRRCYVRPASSPGTRLQNLGGTAADRPSAAPRHPLATWGQVLVRSSTSVDGVVDDVRVTQEDCLT